MALEDEIETQLKDDSAQSRAVDALLNVKERNVKAIGSDIELKTDLEADEHKTHTVAQIISNVIEMTDKEFNSRCVLGDIIEKKERKSLSKERRSRTETVEVARPVHMSGMYPGEGGQGMGRRRGIIARMFGVGRRGDAGGGRNGEF